MPLNKSFREVFMKENKPEIWAHFESEKTHVSLSIGVSYNLENQSDEPSSDWLRDGTLEEAFWENYEEFEPWIKIAKRIVSDNPKITFQQALFSVFGHFVISYEEDGNERDLDYDINADELMYSILKK